MESVHVNMQTYTLWHDQQTNKLFNRSANQQYIHFHMTNNLFDIDYRFCKIKTILGKVFKLTVM